MTRDKVKELVENGREIEFDYNGEHYTISYYQENERNFIAFCNSKEEEKDVETVNDLLDIEIEGKTLSFILLLMPDSKIYIY